jgi:hypothetical protein
MKHLKSFENFDLGRFSDDENYTNEVEEVQDDECSTCGDDELDELEEEEQEEEDSENKRKVWGDELVENSNFLKNSKNKNKNNE